MFASRYKVDKREKLKYLEIVLSSIIPLICSVFICDNFLHEKNKHT